MQTFNFSMENTQFYAKMLSQNLNFSVLKTNIKTIRGINSLFKSLGLDVVYMLMTSSVHCYGKANVNQIYFFRKFIHLWYVCGAARLTELRQWSISHSS